MDIINKDHLIIPPNKENKYSSSDQREILDYFTTNRQKLFPFLGPQLNPQLVFWRYYKLLLLPSHKDDSLNGDCRNQKLNKASWLQLLVGLPELLPDYRDKSGIGNFY